MYIFHSNTCPFLSFLSQKHLSLIGIIVLILLLITPNNVYATENSISTEDILQSQQDALNINSFIEEADKYTEDIYADIDMGELFSSAITGDIDNETIIKSILKAIRRRGLRRYNSTCKYSSYHSYT